MPFGLANPVVRRLRRSKVATGRIALNPADILRLLTQILTKKGFFVSITLKFIIKVIIFLRAWIKGNSGLSAQRPYGPSPNLEYGLKARPSGWQRDWEFQDPLEIMKTAGVQQNNNPNRRITTGQKRALEVLGLDENCAPKDVKPRYKTLLKRYHPDVNDGDRSLEEKLNKVIQAYNFLKASGFC